jgi:3-oxoadipate enol-lactonase
MERSMPYLTRDGVRLYYQDLGSGPAVLLHTGGGGDRRMWARGGYVDALVGYRTLLIDHRGHGRSDSPTGVAAHLLEEYVADLIAVLDDAEVPSAALVGYSAGAQVAYAVARRHPGRVAAVVGIGSVGAPEEEDTSIEDSASIREGGMRASMVAMAATEADTPPEWLIDNLSETDAEMFALLIEAWCRPPGPWLDFPHIQAPTLIVCGENEEPGAPEHARRAAATVPNGEAVVVPGLAHLQIFWRSELTIPPMIAFLNKHWPPRAADL